MFTVSGAPPISVGSTIRLSCAQSTATSTRWPASGGADRRSPRASSSRNAYSPGSGATPPSTITESFPSASSARWVASNDPRASPSGLSCEVTMKRSCRRRASTTALVSVGCIVVSVGRRELVDEVRHANAVLDRAIVDELEVRGPAQLELAVDPRLEHAGRAVERLERALALFLG